ncbi:hypothetical protein TIFTF001_037470 [Ficus carica]|uniref:Uncharacterized protein n=1 Tax=Ficus carica TaxID=3494 RepID=A0AA88E729_FICCA|nr:hypothetical protein TIFTF001_037470 [Ficus carica]
MLASISRNRLMLQTASISLSLSLDIAFRLFESFVLSLFDSSLTSSRLDWIELDLLRIRRNQVKSYRNLMFPMNVIVGGDGCRRLGRSCSRWVGGKLLHRKGRLPRGWGKVVVGGWRPNCRRGCCQGAGNRCNTNVERVECTSCCLKMGRAEEENAGVCSGGLPRTINVATLEAQEGLHVAKAFGAFHGLGDRLGNIWNAKKTTMANILN